MDYLPYKINSILLYYSNPYIYNIIVKYIIAF